ncbi:TetR/AcrR family transcriptional regulator [Pseudoalteromonas sp. MMG012]|nr:TetR/AcrR family transcriptional regulator [Pseudoalteromonas sp. MMG012]
MKLSDKKRLQILDAAQDLFYQYGLDQTSMDTVSSHAGVSKRTVYNHFSSKEVLFHAILDRMLEKVANVSAIEFDSTRPIQAQLSDIATQEVALLTSSEFLKIGKIAFIQMLQQPELAKSLSANSIGCMTYFSEFLMQASAAGALKITDADYAAKQFVYQLKSFTFYPLLYGFEEVSDIAMNRAIEETVMMFVARYQP